MARLHNADVTIYTLLPLGALNGIIIGSTDLFEFEELRMHQKSDILHFVSSEDKLSFAEKKLFGGFETARLSRN